MLQPPEPSAEVKEKILVFIQNNPWIPMPQLMVWWIKDDQENMRRDAHRSVRALLEEGEIVKRTSDSVRGLTGQFVMELHSKDGL